MMTLLSGKSVGQSGRGVDMARIRLLVMGKGSTASMIAQATAVLDKGVEYIVAIIVTDTRAASLKRSIVRDVSGVDVHRWGNIVLVSHHGVLCTIAHKIPRPYGGSPYHTLENKLYELLGGDTQKVDSNKKIEKRRGDGIYECVLELKHRSREQSVLVTGELPYEITSRMFFKMSKFFGFYDYICSGYTIPGDFTCTRIK